MNRIVHCLFLLALLSGCSTLIPVPEAADVSVKQAEEAWSRVLQKHVNGEGRIDFRGLGKNLTDLTTFVRYISKVDRGSFGSQSDRLAFYLNAYNALSMYNVILRDYPENLAGFFKRLGFFALTKFSIAKEEMSLYSFENDLIRKEGDPRVHVSLNCMSAGCPRLPREAFLGAKLEAQFEREAKKFYNEERNVRTDDKEKIVYISEILDFFTEDFIAQKPTLIDYVNQYRNAKVPSDYKVKFIAYDWTIYKQLENKDTQEVGK